MASFSGYIQSIRGFFIDSFGISLELYKPRDLPSNFSTKNANDILKAASYLGRDVKVIRLGISGNSQFSLDAFANFLQACPTCETIDFSHCELDDEKLKIIAKIIDENKNYAIRKIRLCSISKITETGLKSFQQLPLCELNAENCIRISRDPQLGFSVRIGWTGYDA